MPRLEENRHWADWDEPGREKVRALCGTYIRRRDHSNEPTCDLCRAAIALRDERDHEVLSELGLLHEEKGSSR